MGSVSPLLAVAPMLRAQGHEVRFVGTHSGPERGVVEAAHIPFVWIVAPKFRRYVSLWHLLVPFQFCVALLQSLILLFRWRPDVIVSAGGYVSVPVVWVGWVLRIPSVIHQQDIAPGVANRLMAPCAAKITVAFKDSLRHFDNFHRLRGSSPHLERKNDSSFGDARFGDFVDQHVVWIGNPVRDLTPTTHVFQLDSSVPTVLIVGGGTGARAINELVTVSLCDFANVIHVTGKGRAVNDIHHARYRSFEFLGEELKEALAKADLVVSRAGLGFISELATLGKPSIVIPMPNSHQEQNAEMLQHHKAALVVNQESLTPELFAATVQKVLENTPLREKVSQQLCVLFKKNAAQSLNNVILAVGSVK